MISEETMSFLFTTLSFLTYVFVLMIGLAILAVIVVYICDISQTRQALRRNYPVIAHFRYLFEHLGEFFRQYFFAMDREEMPFNRAQTNLGLPRGQGHRYHDSIRFNPGYPSPRFNTVRELSFPNAGY